MASGEDLTSRALVPRSRLSEVGWRVVSRTGLGGGTGAPTAISTPLPRPTSSTVPLRRDPCPRASPSTPPGAPFAVETAVLRLSVWGIDLHAR